MWSIDRSHRLLWRFYFRRNKYDISRCQMMRLLLYLWLITVQIVILYHQLPCCNNSFLETLKATKNSILQRIHRLNRSPKVHCRAKELKENTTNILTNETNQNTKQTHDSHSIHEPFNDNNFLCCNISNIHHNCTISIIIKSSTNTNYQTSINNICN